MKKLFAVAVLAVSTLSIAGAKSYNITLSSNAKAGSLELKPGQYRLKVEGTNAVFTDVNSAKSFTTPVKIETADKKFEGTRMTTKEDAGTTTIQEIDLGGSKTKLGF